jgi:hypothetical protein
MSDGNKVWQPVADGPAHRTRLVRGWARVGTDGDLLWMESRDESVSIELPPDIRLCRLVDATPPAPAAWGPPQAQPDAEGQWAFEGDTPDELNVHWFVKLYYAEYTDGGDFGLFAEPNHADGGYFAGEMIGTWRKLLVDPWEVTL